MSANTERPFRVSIPDEDIKLLHKKLELARFPDELEEAGWMYGAPLADVKRLVARWKDGFDWRRSEAEINVLPQFTRDIEVEGFGTLNIHYVHQRSGVENAVPLLFIHGCKCVPRSPRFRNAYSIGYRAGTLLGSEEAAAFADERLARPSELPCSDVQSARLRVLGSPSKEGLCGEAIRRGM